ncbi:hypothetical protein BD410DRAFT_92536 [Rickenella mellea]|uniref:Uncharacterized protein n=1 Tax=Rickenella mellea TaxID=50990 RepID=A0A4Y7QCD1_9AGAM|nr:hypothetical protein BD410DRAFT_92536 [Rickenella mellea]
MKQIAANTPATIEKKKVLPRTFRLLVGANAVDEPAKAEETGHPSRQPIHQVSANAVDKPTRPTPLRQESPHDDNEEKNTEKVEMKERSVG